MKDGSNISGSSSTTIEPLSDPLAQRLSFVGLLCETVQLEAHRTHCPGRYAGRFGIVSVRLTLATGQR